MRKVITINLNGNAYQVEEAGYNALRGYLEGAEEQLKDNPDCAEILSDLEQAIADKCRSRLGPQKSVITSEEMDTIVKEMGPVDGEMGEAAGSGGTQSEKTQEAGSGYSGPRRPRRLFRLQEGKKIEGVCAGLAAYSGLDVNLLRVVFLLLAILSGGAGAVLYMILVIVIPYAETPEERAAAHGEQVNTQDFINQAREHYSELKKDGKEWKRRAQETHREWRRSWRHSMRNRRYWWGPGPTPPPPGPWAGVALPIFGIVIAALSIVWVLAVISRINSHAIFGWPVPLQFPLWAAILILFVILQAVIAPLRYMRHASRYGYGNPVGGLAAMTASMVWIACLVFAGWFAYTHSAEVHDFIQNLPRAWRDLLNQ